MEQRPYEKIESEDELKIIGMTRVDMHKQPLETLTAYQMMYGNNKKPNDESKRTLPPTFTPKIIISDIPLSPQ